MTAAHQLDAPESAPRPPADPEPLGDILRRVFERLRDDPEAPARGGRPSMTVEAPPIAARAVCRLPHAGRDIVLLAGLSAAADEIRGLRWVIAGLVRIIAYGHAHRTIDAIDARARERELVGIANAAHHREQLTGGALDLVLAREDAAARATRPALRSLLAALEALPALEAAAAQGTRAEVLAAAEVLARALRGDVAPARADSTLIVNPERSARGSLGAQSSEPRSVATADGARPAPGGPAT